MYPLKVSWFLVFPIIGARDYIDQRGYYIHDCATCGKATVFAVYDTRRKLTLYFIPTMNVRSQIVMECMTCHSRWGVPSEQVATLEAGLLTQQQVSMRIAEQEGYRPPAKIDFQPTARTFYQVLQVDPAADPEVIDAAFRRLALKHHPDRSTSADSEWRMRDLIAAREVLADPVRRAGYDASLGIVRRVEALRPEEV